VDTVITDAALDAIRRHAIETFPDECCGALIEADGAIVEAFVLANTTSAGRARRFRIDAEGYRRAEGRARERKGALAGFYHSHPDAPARPSQFDLDHAWPNLKYVIISVDRGVPGDTTVWHLRDDRSGFEQGELRCHTQS